MNHKCFNCANFEAYYSKACCCFLRTDCGHCRKFKETKNKQFSCDSWSPRYYHRYKHGIIIKQLETAITQINGIKLILDERMEELNENKK